MASVNSARPEAGQRYAALWGPAALAALLWPGHLDGPLAGAPLDGVTEAILIGLVAPMLWFLHPGFLKHRIARALIVALVLAKVASLPLAQQGWCVQFDTAQPLVKDSTGRIHAWDVRADWRSPSPRCSAILTRPYREFKEFPVWFFNLPPTDNNLPRLEDRPPFAELDMVVSGYLHADARGELILETGQSMTTSLAIDGREIAPTQRSRHQVVLEPGRHAVHIRSHLTNNRWTLVPLWNGRPIGAAGFAPATVSVPSPMDLRIRGALAWVIQLAAAALLAGWAIAFVRSWRDPVTLGFSAAASVIVAWLGAHPYDNYVMTPWALWSITALGASILLAVPEKHQTLRGAFVLIGIPWLAFVTGVHWTHIGRFSFYAGGDDMWMFQRWAYRIYLQGYWLQGGEPTFWFQPFYRWVAGAWHMVFGDSSMGEFWWDAVCVLASALFAQVMVAAAFGFRWGLAAAVLSLTLVMQSPTWIYLGVGLSDIASAGFIYLAALIVAAARLRGDVRLATGIAAGCVAAVGFYTRLNNLPMACAISAFTIPLTTLTPGWWRGEWWPRVSWRAWFAIAGTIAVAIFLFTLRTYYYTGVFSFFHGTTWGNHALWRAGQPAAQNLAAMGSSLMMVLTFNDPPRFAWYALPLLIGAVVSVAALLGVRGLTVPLPLALFFAVACSGALAARGVAYAGRFSVHLIGAGCALTICAVASIARQAGVSRRGLATPESFRSSDRARA